MDSLVKENLGVICAKMTEFSESDCELQGVFYSFPKASCINTHSFLVTIKGALVTLNHMLPDIVGLKPTRYKKYLKEKKFKLLFCNWLFLLSFIAVQPSTVQMVWLTSFILHLRKNYY